MHVFADIAIKLYEKARAGQISGFTGIDSAYEPPEGAELVLDPGVDDKDRCVEKVLEYLYLSGILPDKAMQQLSVPLVRELCVGNEEEKMTLLNEARTLPAVEIDIVDVQWLQVNSAVLAEGWGTPLAGFMRERQYLQTLHFGQLLDLKKKTVFPGEKDDGALDPWPMSEPVNQSIPIVLPITEEQKKMINTGETDWDRFLFDVQIADFYSFIWFCLDDNTACRIALVHKGKILAILLDGEVFAHRKEERVARQFGFTDCRHPSIERILSSGDWCLGGELKASQHVPKKTHYLVPIFTSHLQLLSLGADAVFVFQLRNPIHNGHALLMRDTREKLLKKYRNPMLLLHPLGSLNGSWSFSAEHSTISRCCIRQKGASVVHVLKTLRSMCVHAYIFRWDRWHFSTLHDEKTLILLVARKCGRLPSKQGATPPEGFMAPSAWDILANYYRSRTRE
uniref:Sulfate adenylyltransferase n=1 Tax=Heterorhabditis bacteriophora TaxID=37862 RepID=A0A1I7XR57_HETBA